MRSVGVIGAGAIGRTVLTEWVERPCVGALPRALLVRPSQRAAAEALADLGGPLADLQVTTDLDSFLATGCDLIIEAAGQGAIRDYGPRILAAGRDLMVISTGIFADAALRETLSASAAAAGARIIIPNGALAGFDGLASLARAGLRRVVYRSSKPPAAWRGTPAETQLNLDEVSEPICFFKGSAAEAATSFPKNANLAATVAMAGLGFDATEVELIADPTLAGNVGQMQAWSAAADLDLTMSGASMQDNPKSSYITAMSILAALDAQDKVIVFI